MKIVTARYIKRYDVGYKINTKKFTTIKYKYSVRYRVTLGDFTLISCA